MCEACGNEKGGSGKRLTVEYEEKWETNLVLTEYKEAPEVTRRRLYIETLEKVLSDVDKIIMDNGEGGQGVVPYLPLNELRKSSQGGSN